MMLPRNMQPDHLREQEFDNAFALLTKLVDMGSFDAMAPSGPGTIYTTSVTIWLLVYQRMHAGASMEEAVKYFIKGPPEFCPDNKRIREKTLSNSTAAYSDGRQRLTLEVSEGFANAVTNSIIDAWPPPLGEKRAFLIDGTTIALRPTKELLKLFPPASNQHGEGVFPIVNLVVAHELESGCALLPQIGPMYGPEAISETGLIERCVAQLPGGSIAMSDAGFGIFIVAYKTHKLGQDFLLRMTAVRFKALRRKATLIEEGIGWTTYIHHWIPSAKERRKYPDLPADAGLDVRLHEVVVHAGLSVYLVTGLPDSATAMASLYRKRLGVEIDIENVKLTLNAENILATTVDMFRKELVMSMVTYNLVVQFRRQAAEMAELPPRRLSFTKVWTTYRIFLENAMHTDPEKWRESYRTALRYAMRDKLPNRPGRNFPREAYPRKHKSSQFKKRKRPGKTDEESVQVPK